jgi:hypothetical protein
MLISLGPRIREGQVDTVASTLLYHDLLFLWGESKPAFLTRLNQKTLTIAAKEYHSR